MVKQVAFLLLAATATASQWEFKDVRATGAATKPRVYEVSSAVAVGRRNLAVLYVLTADEKERKRLVAEHGVAVYLALAWLSSTWKLEELGERFFVYKEDLIPWPSDFTRIERTFSPSPFPKVLVRREEVEEEGEGGKECPYLVVFPHRFSCFNDQLEVTATYEVPFVMNNLRVVEGEVWVVAAWEGHLIHRFDMGQGQLVEHRLPLSHLREAMKGAGVKEEEMASVTSPGREGRNVWFPELDQEATTPTEEAEQKILKDFSLPVLRLPTSFQFDVAVQGSRAAVLVRKPLGLWVTDWPEGGKDSFVRVAPENLPGLPADYTRLYVLGLEAVGKDEFFAAFQVQAPRAFSQWLVEDPAGAMAYQKEQGGRPIPPNEMTGPDLALMGVLFGRDRVPKSWFQAFQAMEKWRPLHRNGVFSYRPGEVWIGIHGKKSRFLFGIGQLH